MVGDGHQPYSRVLYTHEIRIPVIKGGRMAISNISKTLPTDPWSIPQTPNQQFMKEFLSFGGLGMSGVCSRGMLGFP